MLVTVGAVVVVVVFVFGAGGRGDEEGVGVWAISQYRCLEADEKTHDHEQK